MIPSTIAAMSPIPDDRPSRPSMKLMLLIIPAIHRIVTTTPTMPSNGTTRDPNGFAMKSTVIPLATAIRARPTWPRNCQRARRSK